LENVTGWHGNARFPRNLRKRLEILKESEMEKIH
jgi:hypothetical protein